MMGGSDEQPEKGLEANFRESRMARGLELLGRSKPGECHEDYRVRLDSPIRARACRAVCERLRFQVLLGSAGSIAQLNGSNGGSHHQRGVWALGVWA